MHCGEGLISALQEYSPVPKQWGGGEDVNGGRGLAGGLNIARGGEEPAFGLSGLSKELGWKGSGTSYN